jgi:hypothetical protein
MLLAAKAASADMRSKNNGGPDVQTMQPDR